MATGFSNPTAPIIRARPDDFVAGLTVVGRLTDGPVYLCHAEGADLPATPVARLEPAAQIIPAVDGVNSFVGDDFFKNMCRTFPADRAQHQI